MVRPPRRARVSRSETQPEMIGAEEMIRLMDRMEARLGVLERAIGEEPRTKQTYETAANGQEKRRLG